MVQTNCPPRLVACCLMLALPWLAACGGKEPAAEPIGLVAGDQSKLVVPIPTRAKDTATAGKTSALVRALYFHPSDPNLFLFRVEDAQQPGLLLNYVGNIATGETNRYCEAALQIVPFDPLSLGGEVGSWTVSGDELLVMPVPTTNIMGVLHCAKDGAVPNETVPFATQIKIKPADGTGAVGIGDADGILVESGGTIVHLGWDAQVSPRPDFGAQARLVKGGLDADPFVAYAIELGPQLIVRKLHAGNATATDIATIPLQWGSGASSIASVVDDAAVINGQLWSFSAGSAQMVGKAPADLAYELARLGLVRHPSGKALVTTASLATGQTYYIDLATGDFRLGSFGGAGPYAFDLREFGATHVHLHYYPAEKWSAKITAPDGPGLGGGKIELPQKASGLEFHATRDGSCFWSNSVLVGRSPNTLRGMMTTTTLWAPCDDPEAATYVQIDEKAFSQFAVSGYYGEQVRTMAAPLLSIQDVSADGLAYSSSAWILTDGQARGLWQKAHMVWQRDDTLAGLLAYKPDGFHLIN